MLETAVKRILVVDDDNLICWALKKEFTGAGYPSTAVESVQEALSELKRQEYDVVFLDIRLPDGNGIDILTDIERISPDVKVIVMSGNATEANRKRAFECGAVKFLEKPFDLSEVRDILDAAMSGRLKRRKHPRNGCSVALFITIIDAKGENAPFSLQSLGGTMEDCGLGGFRLNTKYPLRVGQKIRVRLPGGNGKTPNLFPPQALAEVVWVSQEKKDGFTAGARFIS